MKTKRFSAELREKIIKGETEYKILIQLMDKAKENILQTLTNDDITGFEYNASSCADQFSIGCFQAATLKFSIPVNEDGSQDWKSFRFSDVGSVSLYIYAMVDEDENTSVIADKKAYYEPVYGERFHISDDGTKLFEEFSMGVFYIDSRKKENDVINIECSDAAVKFDVLLYEKYFDAIQTVKDEGQETVLVGAVIMQILKYSGLGEHIDFVTGDQADELTMATSGTLMEMKCDDVLKFKGKTARELLMEFCEVYCSFCYIDNDVLRFKKYTEEYNSLDKLFCLPVARESTMIDEDSMFSFEYDGTVEITGVRVLLDYEITFENSTIPVAATIITSDDDTKQVEMLFGEEGAVIDIESNIFMGSKLDITYASTVYAFLYNIVKKYIGMKFTPCTINSVVFPFFEVGDHLVVTDHFGVEHGVFITSVSIKDNIEMEIACAGGDGLAFVDGAAVKEAERELGAWERIADAPGSNLCNNSNTVVINNKIYTKRGTAYSYDDMEGVWKEDDFTIPSDSALCCLFSYNSLLYGLFTKEAKVYLYKYTNGINEEPQCLYQIECTINSFTCSVVHEKYLYIFPGGGKVIMLYLGDDESIEKCAEQTIPYEISSHNIVSYNGHIYAILGEIEREYEEETSWGTIIQVQVYAYYICRLSGNLKSYEKLYMLPRQSVGENADGSDGILAVYKNRLHILGKRSIYSFGLEDRNYHHIYDLETGGFNTYSDAPYACYGGAFIEYNGKLHLLTGDNNNYHYAYTEE